MATSGLAVPQNPLAIEQINHTAIEAIIAMLQTGYNLKQIDKFNQRGISGRGICRGMCLDWIRRIMNRKPTAYDYTNPEKLKKRLALQAWTQKVHDDATDSYLKNLGGIRKERNDTRQALESKHYWGRLKFWAKSVAELQKDLDQKLAAVDNAVAELKSKGGFAVTYKSFAAGWKQEMPSRKTKKNKACQFDSFTMTQSPEQTLENLSRQKADEVLVNYVSTKVNYLQADQCCMVLLGFKGNHGDHAIAVHCNGKEYYLFDPNLGIYKGAEQNVVDGLKYLLITVYPALNCVTQSVSVVVAAP